MILSMFAMAIPGVSAAEDVANGKVIGILGDADQSGKIDIKDATNVQKAAADVVTLSDVQQIPANVDGGKLTVNDATWIQKFVAGYDCSALGIGKEVIVPDDQPTTVPTDPEQTTDPDAPTDPEQTTEPTTGDDGITLYFAGQFPEGKPYGYFVERAGDNSNYYFNPVDTGRTYNSFKVYKQSGIVDGDYTHIGFNDVENDKNGQERWNDIITGSCASYSGQLFYFPDGKPEDYAQAWISD